jgi:hypothetical protein
MDKFYHFTETQEKQSGHKVERIVFGSNDFGRPSTARVKAKGILTVLR